MGRISNKNPRRAKVIADPGVAGRVPRAKAMRVNVVAAPDGSDPNVYLGSPSPIQIIEETVEANALENEPVNLYIDDTAVVANIIPNAEPTRVFVVAGSLGITTAYRTVTTPGTDITQTGSGPYNWTNLSAAGVEDNSGAEWYAYYPVQKDKLIFRNFGFSIPGGATILGITALIRHRESAITASTITDEIVRLRIGDIEDGDNKADVAHAWEEVVWADHEYGGAGDVWGITIGGGAGGIPDVADINAAGFGIVVQAQRGEAGGATIRAQVDVVKIKVTYQA